MWLFRIAKILARFGLAINEEKTFDINSSNGTELVGNYSITQVPTIVLTGDLAIYTDFNTVWSQVGTIEKDGTYVFRELSAMGPIVYKDLSTNEIIV